MNREEATKWLKLLKISPLIYGEYPEALDMAIEALQTDTVSREEYTETDGVVTIEKQRANEVGKVKHIVVHSPNYTRYFYNESMPISNELPTATDCTNFLLWLLDEIMDEENWELNAVANGEIIARKLKKLGLLKVEDGYYISARPIGEWEERYDLLHRTWNCSNCGYLVAVKFDYCPNCGAEMGKGGAG